MPYIVYSYIAEPFVLTAPLLLDGNQYLPSITCVHDESYIFKLLLISLQMIFFLYLLPHHVSSKGVTF